MHNVLLITTVKVYHSSPFWYQWSSRQPSAVGATDLLSSALWHFIEESPGPCITNVFATRRKNFSQWHHSFQRKLLSHWLKFLRHVAITLVIQGPVLLIESEMSSSLLRWSQVFVVKCFIILLRVLSMATSELWYTVVYTMERHIST